MESYAEGIGWWKYSGISFVDRMSSDWLGSFRSLGGDIYILMFHKKRDTVAMP
jgi:hypothetical protein